LKQKTDDTLILQLHGEGKSQRKIAREIGCSKTTVLKRLKKLLQNSGHHVDNQQNDECLREHETSESRGPKYYTTQRYIRKIGNDYVYVYSEALMRRGDMEELKWDGEKFVVVTRRGEIESQMISENLLLGRRFSRG